MILVIIQLPRHTQAISAVSIWGTVIDPVLGAQKNYGNPCYYRRKSTTNHDHGQLHVVPLEYWWFCWSLDHIYNFFGGPQSVSPVFWDQGHYGNLCRTYRSRYGHQHYHGQLNVGPLRLGYILHTDGFVSHPVIQLPRPCLQHPWRDHFEPVLGTQKNYGNPCFTYRNKYDHQPTMTMAN